MIGLLDWVKLGAGAAVGAVVAYQVGHWRGEDDGRAAERMAAIERAKELIEERAKDDAEIDRLDDAGWCREFGYRLLPDGTCG